MNIKELATELRTRQQRRLSPTILRAMDDEDMIWSYLQCSECGRRYVEVMLPYVERAADGEDFKFLCDVLGVLHQIKQHRADGGWRGHPDHGGVRLTAIDLQRDVNRWLAGETWDQIAADYE